MIVASGAEKQDVTKQFALGNNFPPDGISGKNLPSDIFTFYYSKTFPPLVVKNWRDLKY
jgi:hypothetical protein